MSKTSQRPKSDRRKSEQFFTDAKGTRIAVVLDLLTYKHLREAEEELADIQARHTRRFMAKSPKDNSRT